MSNEIATRSSGSIVPAWTDEQVALIKRTVCKDATNDELALFLHAAKRSGLDPLAKQIHAVKRDGKMAIQTAIDGYRLIADRTGMYAGNDDPVFDDEKLPRKASVTVYKIVQGVRCGFTATARWDQYYPGEKQGFMWKKMPHLMLGKCAEALALRKAFPAEMSGIYTNEEMDQAEAPAQTIAAPVARTVQTTATVVRGVVETRMPNDDNAGKPEETMSEPRQDPNGTAQEPDEHNPPEEAPKQTGAVISPAQGKRLYAIWKGAGKEDEDVKNYLALKYGLKSTRDILKGKQYDEICEWAAK